MPILKTTFLGLVFLIFILFMILLISILLQIKEYKIIKENLAELHKDIKINLYGTQNKQKRKKIILSIIIVLGFTFLISAIYVFSQRPQQINIISPIEKSSISLDEELIISWEQIPNTYQYHVAIYPSPSNSSAYAMPIDFYVPGNQKGVRLTLGKYIYGQGPYYISVSSDNENTQEGLIMIYVNINNSGP